MSSTHSLLVHSLDGFSWKPCPLRRTKPNLFVAIYQDGVEQRTPAVKRYLTPKWEHLLKLSEYFFGGPATACLSSFLGLPIPIFLFVSSTLLYT
ncbi:hypothetical protein B0H14DRAFT_3502116 [Mycena olivaceomarginata]|nr:hypothetical protein B0H14DRAFT_3502116 [Mycena olivaceomarginata]